MKKTLYYGIFILFLALFIGFTVSGNISVINKSGVNITKVIISPTGDNAGNSTTFSRSISKEQSISIDFAVNPDVCQYDVRFTDDKGREYLMSDVELCGSSEIILVSNKADEVPQIFHK
jgi:hypothetical protein